MAKTAGVWVVTIHHRHGTNVYATTTRKKADAIVLDYVKDEWHGEGLGKKPSDELDMQYLYFEKARRGARQEAIGRTRYAISLFREDRRVR